MIVWLRVCVLAMFCPAFLWRCATVMNLEGGPIDTLPPVIVSMLPDNFTTNFTSARFTLLSTNSYSSRTSKKSFSRRPK